MSDLEAAATLRAKLKAKTGFSSYSEYVKAHYRKHPHLYHLPDLDAPQLGPENLLKTKVQHCSVIDVAKNEEWSITRTFGGRRTPESNLFDTLYDTCANVSLRIVIWHLDQNRSGFDLLDTLGLILRLDPRFLCCVFARVEPLRYTSTEMRPLYAKHVLMGNYVATFGRLEMQEIAIPFVLIAGPSNGGEPLSRATSRNILHEFSFYQDICQVPDREPGSPPNFPHKPVTRTNSEESGFFGGVNLDDVAEAWTRWYMGILRRLITHTGGDDINIDSLPLASLFPVLQLSSLAARDWARTIRSTMATFPVIEQEKISVLYLERRLLRRWIEDTEDNMEHLERYISLHQRSEWLEGSVYSMLNRESAQLVAQVRRLETEVRDFLQIQSSASALEETKKSIELSNLQIQESKRVKIFTVLAFTYVPLNLATSIFGMNLEQLNASGQQLRVFIVTAIVALVLTGTVWFCVDQFNDWTTWRHDETTNYGSRTRTKFSFMVRIAMIWWLVRHGHFSWMRKSGAWFRILINSPREPDRYPTSVPFDAWHLSAGEYVSKFCREVRRGDGFEAFATDPVPLDWYVHRAASLH